MRSKVFIYGGGFLGTYILDAINASKMPFEAVLIKDRIETAHGAEVSLRRAYDKYGAPFAVVNAIGKTGVPNVDWCEDHKEETFFGNVEVPLLLAAATWQNNALFVHISSGCIFDGFWNKDAGEIVGFRDTDEPNFEGSFYSYTKLTAEKRLKDLASRSAHAWMEMHRIRMPFMAEVSPRSLFSKLISYETLVDSPNSITCAEDYVAVVIERLNAAHLRSYNGALYPTVETLNMTNPGHITHRRIIEILNEETGKNLVKKFITPAELNMIVKIPRTNTVLVASEGCIETPIEEAVRVRAREYARALSK